jgi:D-glycero-alpha-D-manno-heptose 1-phosphate guanylyltransferase
VNGFEAIILAGGLGKRIRSVVNDRPKVMIEIAGRPFLQILLDRIISRGVRRVILATGHLHHNIEQYFGRQYRNVEIIYSREATPLGTGGAIWKALEAAEQQDVFSFNGDTLFDVDLRELYRFHKGSSADASMALKPMHHFDRYGTVQVEDGRITGFCEKRSAKEGLINGGVYLLNKPRLTQLPMPDNFSMETDFFEKYTAQLSLAGYVSDTYFIDIGVPEDYKRAQEELAEHA